MWKINKAFLKQHIKAGAHFTFVSQPGGTFYLKEIAFLAKHGIYMFL